MILKNDGDYDITQYNNEFYNFIAYSKRQIRKN